VIFSVVIIYFDEFLVTVETVTELEVNLRLAFFRFREHNLNPQLQKCRFFLEELPWLGHVIGHETLRSVPEKDDAIINIPHPTDKQSLQRLLGMVTYFDFVQRLSHSNPSYT
jgi:hypothetical protein